MSRLARDLLDDNRSGVQVGAGGHLFFRQRRVSFRTIRFDVKDLHRADWLSYQHQVDPVAWQQDPSAGEIRAYAHECSRRFRDFWYRVFDVAVARALFGQGTEILEKRFLIPCSLLDIGVPAEQAESSVPPALHAKILAEYEESRARSVSTPIDYLSDYLADINSDLIELLKPFHRLWDLRRRRKRLLEAIDPLVRALGDCLKRKVGSTSLEERLLASMDQQLLDRLLLAGAGLGARMISSPRAREVLHRHRRGQLLRLEHAERVAIMEASGELQLPESLCTLWSALRLPIRLRDLVRSAATNSSQAFRIDLRLARLQNAERRAGRSGTPPLALLDRRESHLRQFRNRLARILSETQSDALPTLARLLAEAGADREVRHARRLARVPGQLRRLEEAILDLFRNPRPELTARAGALDLGGLVPGNPFDEREIVSLAKQELVLRLRPIRRTTSSYSVLAGDRHGALTLNPVMKLWKEKPVLDRKLPAIALLEMNTRQSVDCLVRLASLADPELPGRRLHRERILRERRGVENLENLRLFLLPGSVGPIREVSRQDFPEFRDRVIGETRTPHELGVDMEEDSVLGGAWYQKFNHCLYYPVGGDNGALLRQIWLSLRIPGPPAFFFALGQFVHDCLTEGTTYYRVGSTITFRECVEDYYRLEDKVMKNRGLRSGRRRPDNSRPGVRFMFAVWYSRLVTEILTGTAQTNLRHVKTERWFENHIGLSMLASRDRSSLREIRGQVRAIIESSGGERTETPSH
ncbi:MAG: hypothetical protein KDK35_12565 [Leptospiraceae bacterium]|nr:hypothetical protein [Leptospiraceae bacterium]